MSKPARATTSNITGQTSGGTEFRNAIDKMREINTKTDILHDGIAKTGKDLANIAKIMNSYVTARKGSNDDTDANVVTKNGKISKMYGSVYKGTYNGIIDGLKKVAKDEKIEKIKQDRFDSAGRMMKVSTKTALKAPVEIAKAIVNLVAWERSEFLNLMRSIYHGTGYGAGGDDIYAKKAFRIMLNQEHERKKLLKKGSTLTQNETIIDKLDIIASISQEQAMRDRKFFITRALLGKKESVQIELLRKISESSEQIENNTGAEAVGMFGARAAIADWMPLITPLAAAAGITLATQYGTGTAGAPLLAQMAGTNLGGIMSKGFSELGDILLNPYAIAAGLFGGIGLKAMITGKRSVSTAQNLVQIEQLDVLKEIRDAVAGEEEDKKGLAGAIIKFKDFSLKKFIFRGKKQFKSTGVDITHDKLDSILLEMEDNTDYQDDILHQINMNMALNRMIASDGREMINVMREGLNIAPMDKPILTPYETDALRYFQGIEQANVDELRAIGDLSRSLCSCITLDKSDDGIYDVLFDAKQDALERGMNDEEESRERIHRTTTLQNTVEDIYNLMVNSATNATPTQQNGLIKKAIGAVTGGAGVLGDVAEVAGVLGIERAQKVIFDNNDQIVSLSEATMNKFCECFEKYSDDDGIVDNLIDLKKRKMKGKKPGSWRRLSRAGDVIDDVPGALKKKGIAKAVGKSLIKKIPVLSAFLGLGFAASRLFSGDAVGAGLELASGLIATAPVLGTAGAVGIDAYLYKRDSDIANAAAISSASGIAESMATTSVGVAGGMVDKITGIEWQDSLSRGWGNTIKAMDDLTEASSVLSALKESQTAGALRQVYQDSKSYVSGGSSTTNINIPISAHDTDRNTNLMNDAYGA